MHRFILSPDLKNRHLSKGRQKETEELSKKPSKLSHAQAASVPLAGLTALQGLRRAGAKEGSKVFIPAGSGGVGSLAIQIAKKRGHHGDLR